MEISSTIAFFQCSSVLSTTKLLSVVPSENGALGFVILSSYLMWIFFIVNWTFFMMFVINFSTNVASAFGKSMNEIFFRIVLYFDILGVNWTLRQGMTSKTEKWNLRMELYVNINVKWFSPNF